MIPLMLALAALPICTSQAETGRTTTVTGPKGNSATRDVTGDYTKGAGYTRSATTTGSNGRTASSSRTVTGAIHGRVVQSTVRGPEGNSAGATVYKGRRGHLRAGSVTGPEGNTRRFLRVR